MSDDETEGRGIRPYRSEDFEYHLERLPGFDGLQLPVIKVPGDGEERADRYYWPVAAVCEDVLHIATWRQIQRLRNNSTTAPLVREFSVKTRQGMRRAVFLAYDGLGVWLQSLNANNLPEGHPLKETLPRFQAAAMRVVNALATGRIPPVAPEEAGPPSERLTLRGAHDYTAFVERRIEGVERRQDTIERLIEAEARAGGPFIVERAPIDGEEAGIVNLPFTCAHGGRYLIRLRQRPWGAPEVVGVVADEA